MQEVEEVSVAFTPEEIDCLIGLVSTAGLAIIESRENFSKANQEEMYGIIQMLALLGMKLADAGKLELDLFGFNS